MTYKTLAKICLAISISPIILSFMGFELTEPHWLILFFGGLAFAILFHTLDEQAEEIEMLRSPKEDSEEWKKMVNKKRKMEEKYPYANDPFPPSGTLSPGQAQALKEVRDVMWSGKTKSSKNKKTNENEDVDENIKK